MERLLRLEDMIEPVLRSDPKTRDSDQELTLKIWNVFFGVNPWAPVCEVMRNKKLPSQESIGRVRRKLQEKDETLRGSRRKEKERIDAQLDFIQYANESDNKDIITDII